MSTEQQETTTEEQEESYTSFMHLHAGGGRVTAAISIEDGPGCGHGADSSKVANIGLAFCSPKDQFCRKTGRLISEGRLKKGKFSYSILLEGQTGIKDEIRRTLYKDLESGEVPEAPRWTNK